MSETGVFENWTQNSQELDPIIGLMNQVMELPEEGLND